MGQTADRVRFWTFANGSWVKLTLEAGRPLHHYQGGPTDEGWSGASQGWEYDTQRKRVLREHASEGRDCDGGHSSGGECFARVVELAAEPAYQDERFNGRRIYRPRWHDMARGWQRDQFAELAGY